MQTFNQIIKSARAKVQKHLDAADEEAQALIQAFELEGEDKNWMLAYLYDQNDHDPNIDQEPVSDYHQMVQNHIKEIEDKIAQT